MTYTEHSTVLLERAIDTSIRSPNHSPRGEHRVSMLLIHATAGSLRSSLAWLTNPAARVSCHYVIGKDGRIYQLVPDELAAWHAGRSAWRGVTAINELSLGIELENANSGRDPYPVAQLAALVWLCREKVRAYDIPPENVVRHLDVAVPRGRKSDPAGFDWAGFRRQLFPTGTPEPSAPYRLTHDAWIRSSPVKGQHIGDAVRGQVVRVVAFVPGERVIRPTGISSRWAQLAHGAGYISDLSLVEIP